MNGPILKEIEIFRFNNGNVFSLKDLVVVERVLNIFIEDSLVESITYSSGFEKELLFGYLYLEKLIESKKDVFDFKIVEGSHSTNCYVKISKSKTNEIHSQSKIKASQLFYLMKELLSKSFTFARTGGTHISGISGGEKLIAYFEDISRRSTIQKLVGFALLNSILDVKILLTSGRISLGTVQFAKRANIQFVVSQSAVTDLAEQSANDNGITLIGFLRGNRFNIYSHPEFLY